MNYVFLVKIMIHVHTDPMLIKAHSFIHYKEISHQGPCMRDILNSKTNSPQGPGVHRYVGYHKLGDSWGNSVTQLSHQQEKRPRV